MKKLALLVCALILASAMVTACGEEKPVGDTNDTVTTDAVTTGAPETEIIEEPTIYEDKDAFAPGTVSKDGYESVWSGIKFTAKDNIKMTAETTSEGESGVYEMSADETVGGASAFVKVYELPEGEDYQAFVERENTEYIARYARMNFTVNKKSIRNELFGGMAYNGTLYTLKNDSLTIYQRIYRAQIGTSICEVSFTYTDEAGYDTLLACFNS